MIDSVNIDGLRDFYKDNSIARSFLDHAAQRERDRAETSVERALTILRAGGVEVSRGEVVNLYQEFEKFGLGKFIVGRRGKPSRFAWSVSIVSVGKAAAGESQTIPTAHDGIDASTEVNETLIHAFHLRPDIKISIELPTDLTCHEANRLAAYIKTLPMDEDTDG